MHHEHERRGGDERNRREVFLEVVAELLVERLAARDEAGVNSSV